MSVLLVLLMFALVMTLGHLLRRSPQPDVPFAGRRGVHQPDASDGNKLAAEISPRMYFHPCHTWALNEGSQAIRVGLDSFVSHLFGEIDRIDVANLYRWVRQGQKLMTISSHHFSLDLPSPVEGIVMSLNQPALRDLSAVATDPFHEGWIAIIQAPCFETDRKNLMQGAMARAWTHSCMARLRELSSQYSNLKVGEGLAGNGLVERATLHLRNQIAKEFFQAPLGSQEAVNVATTDKKRALIS